MPDLESFPNGLADGVSRARKQPDLAINEAISVSVYCESDSHVGEPWLFGTFRPDSTLLKKGKVYWGFDCLYPSGDGHWVPVANRGSMMTLVGTETVDWGRLKIAQQNDLSAAMRVKHRFKCGLCDFTRTARSQSVQLPLSIFYTAGRREVELRGFSKSLDVARRAVSN